MSDGFSEASSIGVSLVSGTFQRIVTCPVNTYMHIYIYIYLYTRNKNIYIYIYIYKFLLELHNGFAMVLSDGLLTFVISGVYYFAPSTRAGGSSHPGLLGPPGGQRKCIVYSV